MKSGPPLERVRRLSPADETRLIELALRFKSATIDAKQATRFLANPANIVVVAQRDGQLAGFALCFLLDRIDRPKRQMFVYEVDVAPEHRRKGVGRELMEWVRDFVAKEQLMEAFVVGDAGNAPAAGLYQATGAHIDGGPATVFVYPGKPR